MNIRVAEIKDISQIQVVRNLVKENPKNAELKHVIWSTLEDTRHYIPLTDNRMPTLQGNYKVPHFDAKGEVRSIFY
jgi:hypothetical protein